MKQEKNVLTIRGNRKDQSEGMTVLHRERFFGEFIRHFSLPEDVLHEKLTARHRDGILTITLPKREKNRAKEILIRE